MNGFTLVRRNLLRNKLRTLLMLVCIAIAFMIYGVLGSFLASFSVKDQIGSADRLMVTSRVNFLQTFPVSHVEQVRRVEGVTAVSYVRWSLGYLREPGDMMPILFIDAPSYLAVSPEVILAPTQRAAFLAARNGVLVGKDLAAERNWRVGDRVTLNTARDVKADGTRHWDFVVSGIYEASAPGGEQRGIMGHYDFFNQGIAAGRDGINWVVVRTGRPEANEAVSRRIDDLFRNSSAETKTQSESAFARAFLSQLGDVAQIVSLVVGVSFVIILLIVGNMMVFTMNERVRELGLLKTLGFPTARILRLIAGEVLLLAVSGGLIGLALAALILVPLGAALATMLPSLHLDASVAAGGIALILVVAFTAGFIPVLKAQRLAVVDALNRRVA